MAASNYIHLEVTIILKETESAFLLRTEECGDIWMPKSQMADPDDYEQGDSDITVSITQWIANEKGLS